MSFIKGTNGCGREVVVKGVTVVTTGITTVFGEFVVAMPILPLVVAVPELDGGPFGN